MQKQFARTQHFLSYATANEQLMYWDDLANCQNFALYDPGVDLVQIFIAISEVCPRTTKDRKIVRELVNLVERNPCIRVREITFKSNVGRDFSSHACNLRKIALDADPDDFILFTNRSAHGPFKQNWYGEYVRQYQKFPDAGLCGSSINFNGHPARPQAGVCTHVQSFAMLSQLRHLQSLKNHFPGEHETDRDDIIAKGEIGLSMYMMQEGKSLTCLAWPQYAFNFALSHHPEPNYLKLETRDQPFRFKLWDNPRRWTPWTRVLWFWRILRYSGPIPLLNAFAGRAYSKITGRAMKHYRQVKTD